MISILIPVFNVQVHELVRELSSQLSGLSIEGEILVYDDYSTPAFKNQNSSVNSIKYATYKELDQNYGRIEIRKLLAVDARYDWLLFIDSDSVIVSSSYLGNYVSVLKKQYDVYAGGTVYQSSIPGDCSKRLHWKYGSKRESVKSNQSVLHTNNFIIRRNIFLELDFPSQLSGYGHEDTWMHIKLETTGKKLFFLNNPVLHSGLEYTESFLKKTENALKNLLVLIEVEGIKKVKSRVRLVQLYLLLEQLHLNQFVRKAIQKRIKKIEKNLKSCNPSLFQFDLYRLYHLITKKEIDI
jgi:hypothetical protein